MVNNDEASEANVYQFSNDLNELFFKSFRSDYPISISCLEEKDRIQIKRSTEKSVKALVHFFKQEQLQEQPQLNGQNNHVRN